MYIYIYIYIYILLLEGIEICLNNGTEEISPERTHMSAEFRIYFLVFVDRDLSQTKYPPCLHMY